MRLYVVRLVTPARCLHPLTFLSGLKGIGMDVLLLSSLCSRFHASQTEETRRCNEREGIVRYGPHKRHKE
jgi:hypothetical protein